MRPHRPRNTIQGDKIAKITSSDDMLVALSVRGELFTFSAPNLDDPTTGRDKSGFKPQPVWALRRNSSAVKVGQSPTILVRRSS